MAWHSTYTSKCPGCAEPYISYAPGVNCPKCGKEAEESYDIIGEALKGSWLNLELCGRILPPDYKVSTLGDHYLRLSFLVLQIFLDQGSDDAEGTVREIIPHINFGGRDYLRPHFQDYFHLLLTRFQQGPKPAAKDRTG